MHESQILLAKSVIAFVLAGVLYLADVTVKALSDTPTWITTLGLPTAMLLVALAGIVALFRALSDERKARIADRDCTIGKLLEDAKDSAEARTALIEATREQTREFRALCDELRNRK